MSDKKNLRDEDLSKVTGGQAFNQGSGSRQPDEEKERMPGDQSSPTPAYESDNPTDYDQG